MKKQLVSFAASLVAIVMFAPQIAIAAPNYHASDIAKQASSKPKKQNKSIVLDGTPSDPIDESGCSRPGTNNFIACYYNTKNFTEFRKYRTDNQINFDWGVGSPDPSVEPDTFSARWSGLFEFEPGVYDFTVTTSDGMKLYADNQLLLDKWFDQPTTTYTVRATITGGQRGVIAEYYENTDEAVAKVSWVKVN